MNEAGVAPPGVMPIQQPTIELRIAVTQYCGRLFQVSRECGGGQRFVQIAEAVEAAIPAVMNRDLKLNVSAAIPAVLLGVGFPVAALKGVPMLARTAGLIAHLNEELEDPIGFALSYQATTGFEYTGDLPANFDRAPNES